MNPHQIARATNRLTLFSVVLLVYWVFAFCLISVFELRVFRENLTQVFGLSVLGILAVVSGALVLNITVNLTRIAEHIEGRGSSLVRSKERSLSGMRWMVLLGFPVIAAVLYFGDRNTSRIKREYLLESAAYAVEHNQAKLAELAQFKFSRAYAQKAERTLKVISEQHRQFPQISLLLPSVIDGREVILSFSDSLYWDKDSERDESDFLYSASKEEHQYLTEVFAGKRSEYRYDSADGHYILFYPLQLGEKTIVMYFSDYSNYGKIGS